MTISDLVLDLEHKRCRALEAGNITQIESLLADDLLYIHAPGTVHVKAQLLEYLDNSVRFHSVQRKALMVNATAELACMTGLMRLRGVRCATDETIDSVSFVTQIWSRREDTWKLSVYQATKLFESMWSSTD
ncbi:nuclear transport factor 2 family protein [Pseudomonas sp. GM33]|uniref:nuclear transport factor 2 family protein n=1 Tax=Pseudomonas sp. GM33 TaxID=1144329 RepID=UPI0005188EFA